LKTRFKGDGMAIIRITQGLLEIDLADVYGWFERAVKPLGDDAGAISFSVREDALLITRVDGSEVARAGAEDFWAWVLGEAMPQELRGMEVAFGVPKVDPENGGYWLAMEFAASNSDDPREWDVMPAFLAEWRQGRSGAAPAGVQGESA